LFIKYGMRANIVFILSYTHKITCIEAKKCHACVAYIFLNNNRYYCFITLKPSQVLCLKIMFRGRLREACGRVGNTASFILLLL
jgi:hypothetical protein